MPPPAPPPPIIPSIPGILAICLAIVANIACGSGPPPCFPFLRAFLNICLKALLSCIDLTSVCASSTSSLCLMSPVVSLVCILSPTDLTRPSSRCGFLPMVPKTSWNDSTLASGDKPSALTSISLDSSLANLAILLFSNCWMNGSSLSSFSNRWARSVGVAPSSAPSAPPAASPPAPSSSLPASASSSPPPASDCISCITCSACAFIFCSSASSICPPLFPSSISFHCANVDSKSWVLSW